MKEKNGKERRKLFYLYFDVYIYRKNLGFVIYHGELFWFLKRNIQNNLRKIFNPKKLLALRNLQDGTEIFYAILGATFTC